MLSIKDYLIILITNTSRKTHLLSCALKCSSKLQEIQNLENFASMVIQGTQVPIYTVFVFFDFSIFFYFYEKTNKSKLKTNKKKIC